MHCMLLCQAHELMKVSITLDFAEKTTLSQVFAAITRFTPTALDRLFVPI